MVKEGNKETKKDPKEKFEDEKRSVETQYLYPSETLLISFVGEISIGGTLEAETIASCHLTPFRVITNGLFIYQKNIVLGSTILGKIANTKDVLKAAKFRNAEINRAISNYLNAPEPIECPSLKLLNPQDVVINNDEVAWTEDFHYYDKQGAPLLTKGGNPIIDTIGYGIKLIGIPGQKKAENAASLPVILDAFKKVLIPLQQATFEPPAGMGLIHVTVPRNKRATGPLSKNMVSLIIDGVLFHGGMHKYLTDNRFPVLPGMHEVKTLSFSITNRKPNSYFVEIEPQQECILPLEWDHNWGGFKKDPQIKYVSHDSPG